MKKQIKSTKVITALLVGTLLSSCLCGFGWEPIPEDEVETENDSDVANQTQSVYGQTITTVDYYNMKDEYELKIEELESQVEELQEENEQLKTENERYERLDDLTEAEWIMLYRVATAEAGYQSREGQTNVVCVVLNRVNSDKFPNTIKEVINASGQFACVPTGLYSSVDITDSTIENVKDAYVNYYADDGYRAEGALYFCKGTFEGLEYLFTDEVGHKFWR